VLPVAKSVPESVLPMVRSKPQRGGGYALSEHVKQYYKTAQV